LIGVVAATGLLTAAVAYAITGYQLGSCDPTDLNTCKGKISTKFWHAYSGACYSAKVSCKGNFVGSDWTANVSGLNGSFVEVSTASGPSCGADASDTSGVKSVKAHCDTGSVAICSGPSGQSQSHAKASVKRRPDLCPVTCVKPDKITGCP
jgi:hypothetical protein